MEPIAVTTVLFIPADEISFTASRSGGPGGQNVNKVSSRVTLLFDMAGSPSLTPEQKDRLRARLSSRLSGEGILRVVCQKHRSQHANRLEAAERFALILREALAETPPRRKTRTPKSVTRRRLETKRLRGGLKQARRRPFPEGE
jgi:ribosome-associated protein